MLSVRRLVRGRVMLAVLPCVVATLALLGPAIATASLPTRIYSEGHYQLHVSLAYQAQASNGTPTSNPAPAPETGLRPYWNFTTQSESAAMNASWSERLELNRTGLGSTQYRIQPVHLPQALGEAHTYEMRALGSPGIEAAVNDSYTGTYYAPINQTCYFGQACPNRYTVIPFTCTLNASNAAVEGDLRTEWIQAGSFAREKYRGYLDPLRPGAVSLGIDFALVPAHENSAKGGAKGENSQSGNSHPGFLAPTCPPEVSVFEPWLSDTGMLSSPPVQLVERASKPGSRVVFFPLDKLIRRGSATSSFSGPATSPTGCCHGTTTYTVKITAHRVR